MPSRRTFAAAMLALTTLISAFLLFQVQPLVSKIILPWFGGSPAVWTTCMLFFQVALFAGYLYAHCLTQLATPRVQGALHLSLLFAALLLLPITPNVSWKPAPESDPTLRILGLLSASVGLPYFLLSATGPLMQAWLSAERCNPADPANRAIYRLYALSNAGSLAALLTYPFLVEPNLATPAQGAWWSVGFALFAVFCGWCALQTRRRRGLAGPVEMLAGGAQRVGSAHGTEVPYDEQRESPEAEQPTAREYALWLTLAAAASAMLLAITQRVCQDVAVIPFLWIVPLALYLMSFIVAFDRPAWYSRRWYGLALAASLVAVSATQIVGQPLPLWLEVAVHFAALFCIAMVCHGELAMRKPAARHLTGFYLMCAGGGALGGVLVGVVAPLVFDSHLEFKLGMLFCYVLSLGAILDDPARWFRGRPRWSLACSVAALAGLFVVLRTQESLALGRVVTASRNFYGVLSVDEINTGQSDRHGYVLRHGRILHGLQFSAPEKRGVPTTYYHRTSGIGVALESLPAEKPRRIGAVGLGVGTIAAYGRPGDAMRFYEINPDVARLARSHFSFLADCAATIDVVLGDGRLSLEREPPQDFDLLALDAFSGDAIPAHLITLEAFEIYLRHLKADGLLAVHITNRHVDLNPVVGGLARHFGLHMARIESPMNEADGAAAAVWVLLTRDSAALSRPAIAEAGERITFEGDARLPLWRDDYSNLLEVLR
jgi:hypothetical protein